MNKFGYEEGDDCNRDKCTGVISLREVENCSCHIHPPCSVCTSPRFFCPECDWDERYDPIVVDVVTSYSVTADLHMRPIEKVRRVLDNTKIDFVSSPHSNSSMIKKGVYPEGTTIQQVRDRVNGTFGGVFISFGKGKFEFKAYTD